MPPHRNLDILQGGHEMEEIVYGLNPVGCASLLNKPIISNHNLDSFGFWGIEICPQINQKVCNWFLLITLQVSANGVPRSIR